MAITRSTQLAWMLILCALPGGIARADDPRNPPSLKDSFQSVLERIHKHAVSNDWNKEGFQDDAIEKWLDTLIGSIAAGAQIPPLTLPVRLANVRLADPLPGRSIRNQLVVGHDVDLKTTSLHGCIVLADGDVSVNVARESVIVARGVVTVNGFSQGSTIVAGTLIKIAQFDGQPGKTDGGSVIVSRGWAEIGTTAYGTIVAAPEGAILNSTQNVTFINTVMSGRDRGGSQTVKVPDLPLGSVPRHSLGAKIKVLGIVKSAALPQSPALPGAFIGAARLQGGQPPQGIVFQFENRRYVADLGQPIVDEAGNPVAGLRDWKLTHIADAMAILRKAEIEAVLRWEAK